MEYQLSRESKRGISEFKKKTWKISKDLEILNDYAPAIDSWLNQENIQLRENEL